jgi:DNA-binding phage protein
VQLVITAVVLEGRSKSEVARDYTLSRQAILRALAEPGDRTPAGCG